MTLPCIHVIEDDASVREGLALVLSDEGYAVATWASGEEFLENAKVSSEDLLLLDLGLPGIAGQEVVTELARRGIRPKTIIVSGIRGRAFDSAVSAAKPIAALRKPLERDMLLSTLRTLGTA